MGPLMAGILCVILEQGPILLNKEKVGQYRKENIENIEKRNKPMQYYDPQEWYTNKGMGSG